MLLNNDLPEIWLGLLKKKKKSKLNEKVCSSHGAAVIFNSSDKYCWRNPRAIWPWLKCFLMLLGGTERNTANKVSNGWRTLIISTLTQTVQLDAFPVFRRKRGRLRVSMQWLFLRGHNMGDAYCTFASLLSAEQHQNLALRVGSVPGNILTAVDTGINDKLRDGLRWLKTHFLQLISKLWVKQLLSLAESKKAKKRRTRWKDLTSKDAKMRVLLFTHTPLFSEFSLSRTMVVRKQ